MNTNQRRSLVEKTHPDGERAAAEGASQEERAKQSEFARIAIDAARKNVAEAVGELDAERRAEKRHASDALRGALARLSAAQRELAVLDMTSACHERHE